MWTPGTPTRAAIFSESFAVRIWINLQIPACMHLNPTSLTRTCTNHIVVLITIKYSKLSSGCGDMPWMPRKIHSEHWCSAALDSSDSSAHPSQNPSPRLSSSSTCGKSQLEHRPNSNWSNSSSSSSCAGAGAGAGPVWVQRLARVPWPGPRHPLAQQAAQCNLQGRPSAWMA
jgi:hypothetical protein